MTRVGPAALAAIHAQAFATPWGEAEFADLLTQAGVFAVVEPDGFILIRVVLDEAEILTLAVRPDARRAGLGGRLTGQGAVEAARAGASRLFLEVAEDNVAARALYDRAGFRPIGRRKAYYAAPEGGRTDALVLGLDLAAIPRAATLP
ncbi:ribosomal protein S18-alanine N-acetyltransferase [Brevundimonas sp.]|jgi:[ribosomal protein S18]-alanine N-acetyltransferase|uniref:ribosomal protein S18-alanine N-acetyltransferase n=1 Tax=Brevundimonas sp. TaxID=1871086 RepID=UPI0017981307|nr:ribosomal protein S18-alanine N-acetyltransferase [Brevundimonas sp.]MBA4807289.1 ribosomal protein S18-alanine N-acetyltransferase [Brevundimonas sp.]